MNILMATNSYAPHIGGLENSISAFSHELVKHGHRIRILAPESEGAAPDEDMVCRVPAIQNIGDEDYSLRIPAPGVLENAIGEFSPEIVHTHHPYVMGGSALRLAHQLKIPLVFTYHTKYEKYIGTYSFSGPVLQRLSVEYPLRFADLSDHVIAPSGSIKSMLEERGLETPCSVIPTGIRIEKFKDSGIGNLRERLGIPGDALVIGHLGRISEEKRVSSLAEQAAAYLAEESGAHMILTGDGPLLEDIKAIFADRGVVDRLHATGALTGDDVVAAYRSMDVFVFASDSETQGLVLAEAMAAGVPVIAVQAPVVDEIVEDMVNGRLVPDVADLRGALKWFRSLSPERRGKLAEAACSTAGAYSVERSTAALMNLYESVISENPDEPSPGVLEEMQGYLEAEVELFSIFSGSILTSILSWGSDPEDPAPG